MANYLPSAIAQFFDDNGNQVSNGVLYVYEKDTSEAKNAYSSTDGTTSSPATSITLDAYGRSPVWLEGHNKLILKWGADAAYSTPTIHEGELVYSLQDISGVASQGSTQAGSANYGVDTGTANTYAVTLDPAITAYEAGLVVRMKVKTTNTGASTLAVNGLQPKTIQAKAAAVTAGQILAGTVVELVYNGTYFDMPLHPVRPFKRGFASVALTRNAYASRTTFAAGTPTALELFESPTSTNAYLYDSDSLSSTSDRTTLTINDAIKKVFVSFNLEGRNDTDYWYHCKLVVGSKSVYFSCTSETDNLKCNRFEWSGGPFSVTTGDTIQLLFVPLATDPATNTLDLISFVVEVEE